MDNHGFRYFDPEAGRYVSRDPIGYADGMNVYVYVHNNPINFIDPLGLNETGQDFDDACQVAEWAIAMGYESGTVPDLEGDTQLIEHYRKLMNGEDVWGHGDFIGGEGGGRRAKGKWGRIFRNKKKSRKLTFGGIWRSVFGSGNKQKPPTRHQAAPPSSSASKPRPQAQRSQQARTKGQAARSPERSCPRPETKKSTKAGEKRDTKLGRTVHERRAEERRQSREWDDVNQKTRTESGSSIEVPKHRNMRTGEPSKETQTVRPDAASYEREDVLDDKPMGRPISKDKQEIRRNIEAYEARQGKPPKRILIERYDPKSGRPVQTDLHDPDEFRPKSSSEE